jgi:hypothetical protein
MLNFVSVIEAAIVIEGMPWFVGGATISIGCATKY